MLLTPSQLSIGRCLPGLRPKFDSGDVWTPGEISGLVAAIETDDVSNLFQDSAGTTPVASDEDPIGKILDLSGNGNHYVQGTTAAKPTWKATIQNGLGIARFDGGDHMLASLVSKITTTTTTIVVAGVRTSIFGYYQAWGSLYDQNEVYDYNTALNCICCYHGTNGESLSGYRVSQMSNVSHPGDNVPYLTVEIYDGSDHTLYHNGSGATPVASTGNFGYDRHLLGARHEASAVKRNMTGDLFACYIYSTALSSEDRASLESYINAKWAVY